ncbi:MAG: hypothetical protein Q8S73_28465 [Deltaproteobacteria bacterium]|nr:hypothetical protein [Myxococcales bacterium]MDP3218073.1 hypothetical protein [Deltaproteobacteria bacterium]
MARHAVWAFVGGIGCATHRLPPPVVAASSPTARVDFADASRPVRAIERRPDGTLRLLCGGVRAEVSPSGVTLGDVSFRADLLAAMHVARGWVFVAADGATARSDTYTGPLQPLPALDFPGSAGASGEDAGVASALGIDGAVLLTDGAGPFAATPAQPPAFAVGAAFVDARRGVALLETGEFFATDDGGARWAFEGRSERAWPARVAPIALLESEAEALRARLRAALLARNGGFFALGPRLRLPDGAVIVEGADGLAEVSLRGERRPRTAPTSLALLARERHGGDLAGYEVYGADLSIAASVDREADDDATALRVGRVGRGERLVDTSRPVTELAGLDATRAWGWADEPGTARRSAVQIDLVTGRVDPLLPAGFAGPCRAGVCEFVADGTLFAVDGGRLFRGGHGEAAETPLPDGATRMAFADAARGMAFGPRRDRVWLTRDGARSWQAVDLGGPIDQWSPVDRDASCHAFGCFVAGLAIEGYDASRLRVRALGNATPLAAWGARWVPPWADHPPAVECAPEGRVDLPPWTETGREHSLGSTPAGQVRLLLPPAAPVYGGGACLGVVEWRGVDADGPFHGAAAWASVRRCDYVDATDADIRSIARPLFAPLSPRGDVRYAWLESARRRGSWVLNYLAAHRGPAVSDHRALAPDVMELPAEHRSVPGHLFWVARAPGRARFVPADRTLSGEAVEFAPSASLAPCRTPPRREALRVAVPIATRIVEAGTPYGRGTVEIADGAACLRSVQGVAGYASLAWAGADGALTGVAYDPRAGTPPGLAATRLRCALVPAAGARRPST